MSLIDKIKTHLTDNYRSLFGETFSFLDAFDRESTFPAWLWVDENLKVSPAQQDGGVIADPEIGICLFVLPYNGQKLQAQIAKALSYRSKLLFEYAPDSADNNGMWNIVIHWYIQKSEFDQWVQQVANIRRESSQIEEVPIDAIVYDNDDIELACEKHRFPRLLLQTRNILAKQKYDDIEKWSSANDKIKLAVQNAKLELGKTMDHQLHQQIFNEIEKFITSEEQKQSITEVPEKANTYQSLSAKSFRNINTLTLPLGDENSVTASIVHGPNGTGKSSLFEAFSFGIGFTSKRYKSYLEDKNRNRKNTYKQDYLGQLNKDRTPEISINENHVAIDCEHDESESAIRLNLLSGTLLSQEQTGDFTKMSRNELGGIIVGQSSTLAMALQDFIMNRYAEVREKQKDFLKRYGINAQVKKIETASEKIIQTYLNEIFVAPSAFLNWLSNDHFREHPFFINTNVFIKEWEEFLARKESSVKALLRSDEEKSHLILELLLSKHLLLSKNHEFYEALKKHSVAFDYVMMEDIEKWALWLQTQNKDFGHVNSSHIREIKVQRDTLAKQREKVIKNGQQLKGRIEHIQTVQHFMETHAWEKNHPNECPSCGSDLTNRQGAIQAIALLLQQSQDERAKLLDEYKVITEQIKHIEEELFRLGDTPNPVSLERQNELQEKLLWLIPEDISFSTYLTSQENLIFLQELVQAIQLCQPINEKVQDEDSLNATSIKMAQEIECEFLAIKENFAQERAWTEVEKFVNQEIMHIIHEHLPSTYQLLWMEIAKALTPAPWQYRGEIQLDADLKNKQSTVTVDIVGKHDGIPRLAHYILNGAETHVLGLAWFFTRYLTFGRFHHAAIVLDDPAQEMDQHTFKDLCRFFEVLIRLHQIKEIPLSFVVMLHQDERAIELVRMLNGWLHQLRWNHNGDVDMTTFKLMVGEFKAPYPSFLSIA